LNARLRKQAKGTISARKQAGADESGWEAGRQAGWKHGYHVGACEALQQKLPPSASAQHPIRLLYVRAGLRGPFPDLDQAVTEALRGMVGELIIAGPSDNLIALAARSRPDLVLVMHGTQVPGGQVQGIRALGIKTAIWLVDEPYVTDVTTVIAPQYEWLFTHELASIPIYRQLGCQVHYMPLAVNPAVYKPKYVAPQYQSDICFIGNAFFNRVSLIDRIAPTLAARDTRIVGLFWKRLRRYRSLSKGIRVSWISADEAANYYNGAKIVINIHRSHDDKVHNKNSRNLPGLSINPRTYEISASGAFQLTDVRQDLADFYMPGVELETYSSANELVDKIVYYLQNEEQRKQIALNGYKKTLAQHTYQKRVSQLLQIVFP
jgi:spore maturation protein CgeB